MLEHSMFYRRNINEYKFVTQIVTAIFDFSFFNKKYIIILLLYICAEATNIPHYGF